MVATDSDDYELMPRQELEDLRHEVSMMKNNSLKEGDKARMLIDAMDRLTISINRFITILDDAQKDIIDEYQESKPAEKLNQLLEQNEMIAKALVSISENMTNYPKNVMPASNGSSMPSQYQNAPSMQQQNMQGRNTMNMMTPSGMYPPPQQQMSMNNPAMQQNAYAQNPLMPQMKYQANPDSLMPPMDDLPPIDPVPPLDSQMPPVPKKKFLGIM